MVATYLNRPVSVIGDPEFDTFPAFVDDDALIFDNDSTGQFLS